MFELLCPNQPLNTLFMTCLLVLHTWLPLVHILKGQQLTLCLNIPYMHIPQ